MKYFIFKCSFSLKDFAKNRLIEMIFVYLMQDSEGQIIFVLLKHTKPSLSTFYYNTNGFLFLPFHLEIASSIFYFEISRFETFSELSS